MEEALDRASSGKSVVAASFISLTEIFYNTVQVAHERRAQELITIVKSWPIDFLYPDEALSLAAGEFKAKFPLSFADAFVAATARAASAILMHKDPEFESLDGNLRLQSLPYKTRRR